MIPRGQKRGEKWRNGIRRQAKELRAEREKSQAQSSAPSPQIVRALPLRSCRMRVVSSSGIGEASGWEGPREAARHSRTRGNNGGDSRACLLKPVSACAYLLLLCRKQLCI